MLVARIAVAAMLVIAMRNRTLEERARSQVWFRARSKMKTQAVLRRKFSISRKRKELEKTSGLLNNLDIRRVQTKYYVTKLGR